MLLLVLSFTINYQVYVNHNMGSLKYNYKNNRISIPPRTTKPRIVRNLIDSDFSTWSVNNIPNTGTGTVTLSTTDTDNDTASFTTVVEGTGRYFLYKASAVLSGNKYYAFGVELDANSVGTFSGTNLSINHSPAEGSNGRSMTVTNTRQYFTFRPNGTGSLSCRVGQGCSVDTTLTAGENFIVKHIFLFEIQNLNDAPPEYVPYPDGIALPYDKTTTGASNIVTATEPVFYTPRVGSTVLCVLDSFGNDSNDCPSQLNLTSNREVYNASVGGDAMDDFLVTYNAWVASPETRYPQTNTPKVVVFGTGVNDVFANRSLSVLQANVQALVDSARANDMIPIILNIPPFGTHASYSGARETVATDYNNWLASQDDFLVVDIFSALLDKTTSFTQLASFGVGDGLHPSTTASIMIASLINEKLKEIENQCDA